MSFLHNMPYRRCFCDALAATAVAWPLLSCSEVVPQWHKAIPSSQPLAAV